MIDSGEIHYVLVTYNNKNSKQKNHLYISRYQLVFKSMLFSIIEGSLAILINTKETINQKEKQAINAYHHQIIHTTRSLNETAHKQLNIH